MDIIELKDIFEYELKRKLAQKCRSPIEELRKLISALKFYDFSNTMLLTKDEWIRGVLRTGLCGFNITDLAKVFDLYDPFNEGYVFSKDALKILSSMGRKIEPEDEFEFLAIVDPKNEGRVTKANFISGVETMYTIPDNFIPEIVEAFKVFDTNHDGKITCKELKDILVNLTNEYKDKDVDELFKILDLDINGEISIDEFINAWKFQ